MAKATLLTLLLVVLLLSACRPTVASAPSETGMGETIPAQVVTPKPPVNASVDVDPKNWPKTDNTPPVLPPPFLNKPNATEAEKAAWRKEMEDKGYISKTKRIVGPETMGATIIIRGVQIKLPNDTFILMNVQSQDQLHIEPAPAGKPWDMPYYVIMRGKSTINVNAVTGKVQQENVARGEELSFEFLKKALQ